MGNVVDNRTYWNGRASEYDAAYQSFWSSSEDSSVTRLLRSMNLPPSPTVVDLGCGTGLGLRLLGEADIRPHYFGVDIAEEMLGKFDAGCSKPETLSLHHLDIGSIQPASFPVPDLVLSTFGSMNFVAGRWYVVEAFGHRQRSGSKILLMLLNRWSLGRLIHARCSSEGRYRTRSMPDESDVWAYFDTCRSACRHLDNAGYEVLDVSGGGPLSGVFEARMLWSLNERIGIRTTFMSHLITIVGERR